MGFCLKVYVIQKKFRFLNLGSQEKTLTKCELTLCVSSPVNGMYIARALNQDKKRKEYIPVYIFIDCATGLKHYNNYYFSVFPKSPFMAHYHEEGKNTKRKQTFRCHYRDMFFRYKGKF